MAVQCTRRSEEKREKEGRGERERKEKERMNMISTNDCELLY